MIQNAALAGLEVLMPKKRAKSSDEYYKGEIRKLRKQVGQLRKMLDKYSPSQDEETSMDSDDTHPKKYEPHNICNECGKGTVRRFELIGYQFEECNVCDFRRKLP